MKPLGIEVSLINTDTKTHYGLLEQKGDYDVARAGWIADYKDPESFLGISRKASGNNYSNFNNPKFEEAMDKAASAGGKPEEDGDCLGLTGPLNCEEEALVQKNAIT